MSFPRILFWYILCIKVVKYKGVQEYQAGFNKKSKGEPNNMKSAIYHGPYDLRIEDRRALGWAGRGDYPEDTNV